MPTKLNKAGKQQPYVPKGNGDASGEYGNHTGSNKHFQTFGKKEITNFGKKEFKGFSSNNKIVNDFRNTVIKNKLAKLKEKNEQQIDNINLDLSQPITKVTDKARNVLYLDHPKEVVDLAVNKIRQYEPIVDNIANDLLNSTTAQGGLMIGLDFRLKRPESLARKIQSEVLEAKEKGETITFQQAVDKMGDVARFTSVFDSKNFQQNADKVLRDLQGKGYEIVKFKNFFQPGASYKGLNCNLKDKNGNMFELQFHTPETMKIKEGYNIDVKNRKATVDKAAFQSHDVYETTRVLEDKIRKGTATPKDIAQHKALKEHNIKMWDSIQYNFNNWTIDNYKQQPKVQSLSGTPVGKIKTYKPVGRTTNGEIGELGTEVRAKTLHNGLLMETKKNPKERFYGGSKGNYKIIDEETGTLVGFAKDYEDAIKYSQNREWLDRIKRAKEVFFKRYPHLKKGTQ